MVQPQSDLQPGQPSDPDLDFPEQASSRIFLMVGGFLIAGLLLWLVLSEVTGDDAPASVAAVDDSEQVQPQEESDEPAPSGAEPVTPPTTTPPTPDAPDSQPDVPSVEIVGDRLPSMAASGLEIDPAFDQAIGMTAPTLSGFDFNGNPVTIGPDGAGKAVVFVAHWCPHCQEEVPLIVDLVRTDFLPAGVEIYGVSTAVDPSRGNYPPDEWLDREGWTFPVLQDSDRLDLFDAFGGTGFPYAVYLDGSNTVIGRSIGSMGPGETKLIWELLATE